MTAATRRTAGRAAALAGREWEVTLGAWHTTYRRERRAWVVHSHPAVKRVRMLAGGQFIGVADRTGPPDFIGVIGHSEGAGGRAVVFDAKSCAAPRWPLADLEVHQARDLEAAHLQGAVAFVALRLNGTGWVLPWGARDGKPGKPVGGLGERYWTAAEGKAARGAASLTEDDLYDLGLPMDDDGWLGAVTRWWGPR